ncbi:hypothetical protein [Metasolibacillus sp.]|uniref:hypothetical protein n=1 Tax=Metasolibacillus sp. TaxID=2703680 RepID=UPI0025E8A956|nr:hypothetical protein [Metasolibacillus sp.]MCT6922801.1 hypothetical protein [Metasolibacillus sp.]MCT6938860.1 hypothetical protein [Metasolibacillus sp.]
MSIFKSDLFLTIIALAIFGLVIAFVNGVFDPLLGDVGEGMRSFVRSKFAEITGI